MRQLVIKVFVWSNHGVKILPNVLIQLMEVILIILYFKDLITHQLAYVKLLSLAGVIFTMLFGIIKAYVRLAEAYTTHKVEFALVVTLQLNRNVLRAVGIGSGQCHLRARELITVPYSKINEIFVPRRAPIQFWMII